MSSRIWRTLSFGMLFGASGLFAFGLRGGEPRSSEAPSAKPSVPAESSQQTKGAADEHDKNIVYLTEDRDLWVDKKNKQVVMKGKIAVREGNLEMFACPQQSKEYESIIAVTPRKMESVHAGLLVVGAKPGNPAKFDTKFIPATGSQIEVTVRWTDKEGKHREARGQDWVRNIKTGKPLEFAWVFGGSGFWTDPDSGEKRYQANDGDFICVVNFPDSLLDLSIESPKDWSEHFYEPFTDRIPPKGTDVELVLTPKPGKETGK
ncbi:MAG TPA: YdjY domain-containing protein [Pirellulales bacterium]|nr:YdjY domain-containing protein [Pirellulales bacterium]